MARPHQTMRRLSRTLIYQGRVIRLFREVIESHGRRLVREVVQHPGAAVIVPLLPDGRIVFVRQYRRAVERSLLELPAGTLEPQEPPVACARREVEEETGWRASRMRRIGAFYPAPGFASERMTLFLATGLSRVPARPEPDEVLRPVILSMAQALAKIRSGAICDAKTIIGILSAHRILGSRLKP